MEGHAVELRVVVNGAAVGEWKLERAGLFVMEADLPDASEYRVTIEASPVWMADGDGRLLTVSLSMIRLAPRA